MLLELGSDSIEAISLVLGAKEGEGDVVDLVRRCTYLLGRLWDVQIKHVLREANVEVDKLAK